MTTTTMTTREKYLAVADLIRKAGYSCINGYGKGGFWVRNTDGTKPAFVSGSSFIAYRDAKKLFASA